MTREGLSGRANKWLQDACTSSKKRGARRVPVLRRGGKPNDILYSCDALQHLLGELEDEKALLRDYVMNVGYRCSRSNGAPCTVQGDTA